MQGVQSCSGSPLDATALISSAMGGRSHQIKLSMAVVFLARASGIDGCAGYGLQLFEDAEPGLVQILDRSALWFELSCEARHRDLTKASSLEQLQACDSLSDLARLIGFTPKGLAYVIHSLPKADRYRTFEIPKKSGGTRTISAPDPRLALAQRRLARLLYQCWHEVSLEKVTRRPLSHGFHKKLSIVTNAREHRRRRYVLNLDLQDFFGTINFGRVRGYFIGDNRFLLKPDVATVIAQIACQDNSLPQGAPSSPVISNLVGHILDVRLARFAKKQRLHYSRYVDDITFSTNEKAMPSDAAVRVGESREWQLGQALRDTIARAGFEINDSKTRMQIRGSRQVATGLVVNSKVNVAIEYYRETRAMCDALFRTGIYHRPNEPDTKLNSLAPLKHPTFNLRHIRQP